MAKTPEGKIKDIVAECLEWHKIYPAKKAGAFPPEVAGWYIMPTTAGLGVKGIPDFIGFYRQQFFAIETKAPGKKPTGFQALQIAAIRQAGGAVFVVDGEESLKEFEAWLHR
jgi:hypothetical protein